MGNNTNQDPLNTERLAKAIEAVESFVQEVSKPIASGAAQEELLKLRKENIIMQQQQQQARENLDSIIKRIETKGL